MGSACVVREGGVNWATRGVGGGGGGGDMWWSAAVCGACVLCKVVAAKRGGIDPCVGSQ